MSHTSHKSKPRTKTDADRAAIRRRKTIRAHGHPLPAGVTSCAYCHRPAGRDKDAGQTGEMRQTAAGNWICCRHSSEFKTAKAM
jgi:hypothetical protein